MNFPKYRSEYTIRENECDADYNIRLAALWDIMQDCADNHASILGFNHETMRTSGNFFALIRMDVHVKKYPKAREKIIVETYPVGVHKLFCVRKYDVFDEAGEKIAEGISLWIIVDIKTNRPLRPQSAYPEMEIFNYNYGGEIPSKLNAINEGKEIKRIVAEFCDIDGNAHVNNSRYINWLENAIRLKYSPIYHLTVNYITETKLSEQLTIRQNNNIYTFADDKNNIRFIAEIKE